MTPSAPSALERRLRGYRRVCEVGIGTHTRLARRLVSAGVEVVAIDVNPVVVPGPIRFIRADVRTVDPARIVPVGAVYGRNLPPELHRPIAELARDLGADLLFTTLGGDPALVGTESTGDPPEVIHEIPAPRSEDV